MKTLSLAGVSQTVQLVLIGAVLFVLWRFVKGTKDTVKGVGEGLGILDSKEQKAAKKVISKASVQGQDNPFDPNFVASIPRKKGYGISLLTKDGMRAMHEQLQDGAKTNIGGLTLTLSNPTRLYAVFSRLKTKSQVSFFSKFLAEKGVSLVAFIKDGYPDSDVAAVIESVNKLPVGYVEAKPKRFIGDNPI